MAELVPTSWKNNLMQLRENVNRAFDRWLSKRRGSPLDEEGFSLPPVFESGGPAVDIGETDDEVIVIAELPGLGKNDFKVEVTQDRLVIRGNKERSYEKRERNYSYSERSYGSFARAVALPCEVNPDRGQARYEDGLLRVTLPKAEQAKTKRVKIRVQA